jgi:hypothetical protein
VWLGLINTTNKNNKQQNNKNCDLNHNKTKILKLAKQSYYPFLTKTYNTTKTKKQ